MATEEQTLRYRGKMILAPMVKIGSLPTRLLCLKYGADLVYTEETIDWRLLRCKRILNEVLNTVDYIDTSDATLVFRTCREERSKVVLQIGTCDGTRASRIAGMVKNDVSGIDVNMGCPKSFSLKGGMGAALLTQPVKVRDILSSLIEAVKGTNVAITCKIRILSNIDDTLSLIKIIEDCGVAAIGVHGRTKDERPSDTVDISTIRKIAQHSRVPIIANGGSSNNRLAYANTFEGIKDFWKATGADSVMVARAAEWNPSLFCGGENMPVEQVIEDYLNICIQYGAVFVPTKYCIQQILGSLQDSPRGKLFLSTGSMQELCAIFGKEQDFLKAQQKYLSTSLTPTAQPSSTSGNNVTRLLRPFVRRQYKDENKLPKSVLKLFAGPNDVPHYTTFQTNKVFHSEVFVGGRYFSSLSKEKNRRNAEQAAAKVALHFLLHKNDA